MAPRESTDRTTGDYVLLLVAFAAFTTSVLGFLFGSASTTFVAGGILVLCVLLFRAPA